MSFLIEQTSRLFHAGLIEGVDLAGETIRTYKALKKHYDEARKIYDEETVQRGMRLAVDFLIVERDKKKFVEFFYDLLKNL